MRLFYLLLFIFVSVGCYGQEKGIVQEIVTINDTLYEVSHGELFVIDTKHVLIKPKASVKQLPEAVQLHITNLSHINLRNLLLPPAIPVQIQPVPYQAEFRVQRYKKKLLNTFSLP